jgi:hypothetical protein
VERVVVVVGSWVVGKGEVVLQSETITFVRKHESITRSDVTISAPTLKVRWANLDRLTLCGPHLARFMAWSLEPSQTMSTTCGVKDGGDGGDRGDGVSDRGLRA